MTKPEVKALIREAFSIAHDAVMVAEHERQRNNPNILTHQVTYQEAAQIIDNALSDWEED